MKRLSGGVAFAFVFAISVNGQTAPRETIFGVPDINGRAISLVKPAFPETAVDVGADGELLTLRVVVDENGNAVSADCSVSCHPMLKDAAELAAMTSKFKPLLIEGRAVRYSGLLSYTFVVNHVNWYRFGTFLESARQFDNISFGPAAQILSKEFASEKTTLMALDADGGVDYEARQKGIAEVIHSLKSKLKGTDLWRFEFGMALRRITFWPSAVERIDRVELQKAIDNLPAVIASAPEEIPESLITELTAISKFRVPVEISEQKLRQAISDLTKNLYKVIR